MNSITPFMFGILFGLVLALVVDYILNQRRSELSISNRSSYNNTVSFIEKMDSTTDIHELFYGCINIYKEKPNLEKLSDVIGKYCLKIAKLSYENDDNRNILYCILSDMEKKYSYTNEQFTKGKTINPPIVMYSIENAKSAVICQYENIGKVAINLRSAIINIIEVEEEK